MGRHNPFRILDGLQIALEDFGPAGEPGNVGWHQLAVVGKWDGHWMGPFSVNEKDLEQMEQHARASAVEIPVDYGHATLFEREAPAAGWLRAAERRVAGGHVALFGQIAWTDRAAAAIRAKEYRYLSPTIQFHTRDRHTRADSGTSLHSVALTNKPFLHELPQVTLNSMRAAFAALAQEEPMNEEQRKKMAKSLGLAEDATEEQIFARASALEASRQEYSGLLSTIGASDGAGAQRVVLELRTAATAPPPAGAQPTEVERLKAENTRLKAAEQQRAALSAVTKAQTEGRVLGGKLGDDGKPTEDSTPNFKAAWEFACRDLEGFKAYIATVEKRAPVETEEELALTAAAPEASAQVQTIPLAVRRKAASIKVDATQSEVNAALGISDDDLRLMEAKYPVLPPGATD